MELSRIVSEKLFLRAKYVTNVLWLILFFATINGCSIRKFLGPNEYLLSKQSYKGNHAFGKSDLKTLMRQQINRSILGVQPYLYAYYTGKRSYDTSQLNQEKRDIIKRYDDKLLALGDSAYLSNLEVNQFVETITDSAYKAKPHRKKINRIRKRREKKLFKINRTLAKGNWLMRVVGEPPSLYDSAVTMENVRYIKSFYHNNGFFKCEVRSEVDTVKKLVKEKYIIDEKDLYRISSLELVCNDTIMSALIQKEKKDAVLKVGMPYRERNFTEERDRINKLFKNAGYYDFTPQYINFEVDTTQTKKAVDVTIVISDPNDGSTHTRYTISKIFFYTDNETKGIKKDTFLYKNVYFVYHKDNFSKRILCKKLQIKIEEYYSQEKVQQTQRQLAALDTYKFININFEKEKNKDGKYKYLAAYIRTNPLKKFQSTEELGLSVASNFIPGPAGSLNFKSRNTFRSFEIFEINLRATVVGQVSFIDASKFYRSEEYVVQNSLSFQQLFFPLNPRLQTFLGKFSPVTRFSSAYTNVRRPEYRRENINANMNYLFTLNTREQFSFSLIDLNLVSTANKSDEFLVFLDKLQRNGNNLVNSFGKSFVTDMNSIYTYSDNIIGQNKKSKFIRIYAESGGTLLNILNSSNIYETSDTLLGLKTFRYFKFNTDFRFYFPVRKNTFAMRYNLGIARAYDKEEILPYERNFFLGGANSLRAWAPRRLGPGSWVDSIDTQGRAVYQYEQPGSLMLETSWEYRFKVIKFVESALFVDAGNLWIWAPRLGVEKARPEGVFYVNKFLSQIAVGTGIGLRLNFSFLILRFDFGFKVKDPSKPEGNRWIFLQKGYRSPNINLSIGYPF